MFSLDIKVFIVFIDVNKILITSIAGSIAMEMGINKTWKERFSNFTLAWILCPKIWDGTLEEGVLQGPL